MKVDKKLKFTFLITKRDLGNKIVEFLKGKGLENYFYFYGKGSASVALLDYLGIGESEKSIIIYPSNDKESFSIMNTIRESEYFKDTIMFKVPIKGISSMNVLNGFFKDGENNE